MEVRILIKANTILANINKNKNKKGQPSQKKVALFIFLKFQKLSNNKAIQQRNLNITLLYVSSMPHS
ncbi:MAG: hypothetical protein ACJAVF_002678, partial [Paraglaciecola sp.]